MGDLLSSQFTFDGHVVKVEDLLSLHGLKKVYDEVATHFDWSTETFASSVPLLFGTMVGYIIVMYAMNAILGERDPNSEAGKREDNSLWQRFLKLVSIIHNFNMMAVSIACFVGILYEVYVIFSESKTGMGVYNLLCDPEKKYNKGKVTFWMYIYYLSKFYELGDTLLIVLRRSQLRFIHTYHHVITMFITFAGLWSKGTGQWVIIFLNTFVHIVMYYYYLLVSVGVKDIPWKNSLTDIQLAQFVLDMISFLLFVYWDNWYEKPRGNTCAGNTTGALFGFFVVLSFFILFFRLRQKNVRIAAKKKAERAKKLAEEEAKKTK